MNRLQHIAAAALLVIGTSGCTTVAQMAASTAVSLSSSTPRQVTTYGQATQAATLVTKFADIAVNSGKLDKPTLIEMNAMSEAVHAAWYELKKANDGGHDLNLAAFNAALDGFNAYATAKGVNH